MQRNNYEYMLVLCIRDTVTTVNGVTAGQLRGEHNWGSIWDYLNRRGSEGWEVVTATSDGFNAHVTYILKRLI